MHILRGRIVTPFQEFEGAVGVENGTIAAVGEDLPARPGDLVEEFGENYICPGFFDLHVHGGMGYEIIDGEVRALEEIACWLAGNGVTGFLGTTMAAPLPTLQRAVAAAAAFLSSNSIFAKALIGLHLEGPCLNEKRAGAQAQTAIGGAASELLQLAADYPGVIKTVTLAPEMDGGLDLAVKLIELGVYPSLGHTEANADQARQAFACEVRRVTHLFNAMPGMHHRDPGLLGEALLNEEVFVEIIGDGVHVAPQVVEMVRRLKSAERLCLISDAIRPSGLPDGEYAYQGRVMTVKGRQIRLVDGTLAGGNLTLADAVRNMLVWGKTSLKEAVQMATATPDRAVGLENVVGSLSPGKRGDIVVLDRQLQVVLTMLHGAVVFRRNSLKEL